MVRLFYIKKDDNTKKIIGVIKAKSYDDASFKFQKYFNNIPIIVGHAELIKSKNPRDYVTEFIVK